MGADSVKYYSSNYVNVKIANPELVPVISAPYVYSLIDDPSSVLTLDGSGSYDPLGETLLYQWDCPEYFGGSSCGTSKVFSKTY
jgi:hypothetical protein